MCQPNVDNNIDRREGSEMDMDWNQASLSMMSTRIKQNLHDRIEEDLAKTSQIIKKACSSDGAVHDQVWILLDAFCEMRKFVADHTTKEKQVVFELIGALETSEVLTIYHCRSIGNPIGVMEQEHKTVIKLIDRISEQTNNYTLPDNATSTYGEMLSILQELTTRITASIELEEQYLFRAAIKREASMPRQNS